MKKLLIFSFSLMAILFVACTSDTEDGMSTSHMYEYSAEEIQQIQKLQEEYGVTFTYPTKSDKELPTVKDYEELCISFACLNADKMTVTRTENSISCATKNINRRVLTRSVESSGSHSGNGSIVKDGMGSYGSFEYIVTWEKKNVTGTVRSISSPGGWHISEDGFSSNFERDDHFLSFTFYFVAESRSGLPIHGLKYSKTISI